MDEILCFDTFVFLALCDLFLVKKNICVFSTYTCHVLTIALISDSWVKSCFQDVS